MNLPNKLTVFRVILIIPFVLVMLGSHAQWGWFMALFGGTADYADLIALVIFVIASLTDMLDGKIARKYDLVTNFGKFMDPLADKLLVCAALICLIELDRIPSWIVIIIISREFIISGFRLVAADNRVVIAANYWGKFKTTFQMVMVCLMIADIPQLQVVTDIVMWVAVVLTVVSLGTRVVLAYLLSAVPFLGVRGILHPPHPTPHPLPAPPRHKHAALQGIFRPQGISRRNRGQKTAFRSNGIPPRIHQKKAPCPISVFHLSGFFRRLCLRGLNGCRRCNDKHCEHSFFH